MSDHMAFLAEVSNSLLALTPSELSRRLWGQPLDFVHLMSYAAFSMQQSEAIVNKVARLMDYEHHHPRRVYQGLDLSLIDPAYRLIMIAAMGGDEIPLDQAGFNFLTLADKGYELAVERPEGFFDEGIPVSRGSGVIATEVDADQLRLAYAFVAQMIREAAPHQEAVLHGTFEMRRVPLPFLDQQVAYDRLRLVISGQGIAGAIINTDKRKFHPFFWSPSWDTTGVMDSISFPLSALLACVWRDACIVKHQFVAERSRDLHKTPRRYKARKGRQYLPRIIRHVEWADDEERERIIRCAHSVKGFYRRVKTPLDQVTFKAACERAAKHGYANPPEGWTFVRPHQRGLGEIDQEQEPREIICKGLQVARIALSFKN